MQPPFEAAKLFHIHTCEKRIVFTTKNPNENFVSFFQTLLLSHQCLDLLLVKMYVFQKEKIENIPVNK